MQTRREFLKGAGAVAAGLALSGLPALAAEPRKKPNVVFVFADQLRSMSLGCYGDKQAITPNIDRLASEGMRFTNAISTWPVCSPFRGMLLTGRYPMSNGVVYNEFPLWKGQDSIATALKAQGYATGYIGKWHLTGSPAEGVVNDHFGFDYWAPVERQMIVTESDGTQTWRPDVQTDKAVEYINAKKDKPFCLFMSWLPPHDPYIAPDKYMKLFPPDKIQLRENDSERQLVDIELKKHPPHNSQEAKNRERWRKIIDSDAGIQRNMQGYYAATHGLDICVGRVMKAIEDAGIAEDTILVFASDHGDMLGSHRMSHKQEPFEESISIPFIIRYPRRIPRGKTTDALLSPMDMMPTLLKLTDTTIPASVEGISLADAALGGRSDQQDAVLTMKMLPGGNPWIINADTEWRGVRTKTHTYARLADGGTWILYDNEHDPMQMHNLVNDPAHKKLQDEMEATMQALLKKAHDPFDTKAIKVDIRNRSKGRVDTEAVPGGATLSPNRE